MLKYSDNMTPEEVRKLVQEEETLNYIYGVVQDMENFYYNQTYYSDGEAIEGWESLTQSELEQQEIAERVFWTNVWAYA